MPEDYATKDDIKKLEQRLYGQIPKQFEDDIGDLGHIQRSLRNIEKQQDEILGWKKRVTSIPAKVIMGLSAIGIFIAALNGILNLMGM